MANSVSSLLYKAGGSLARPASYDVFIGFPDTYKPLLKEGDNYNVLCSAFTVPSIKNEILDFKYKGHTIPIKGRSDYEKTFSVTFILDEGHLLKKDFDNWISALDATYINPSADASLLREAAAQNRKSPFGTLSITGKTFEDSGAMSYVFEDCFPTSVSGVEFAGETQSTVLNITVEFAFLTFSSFDVASGSSSFFDRLISDNISNAVQGANEQLQTLGNNIESSIFDNKVGEELGIEVENEVGTESANSNSQVTIPSFNTKMEQILNIKTEKR